MIYTRRRRRILPGRDTVGRPNYASELHHQAEENARYADGTVDSEWRSANWSWDSDTELWLIHGVSFPLEGVHRSWCWQGEANATYRSELCKGHSCQSRTSAFGVNLASAHN